MLINEDPARDSDATLDPYWPSSTLRKIDEKHATKDMRHSAVWNWTTHKHYLGETIDRDADLRRERARERVLLRSKYNERASTGDSSELRGVAAWKEELEGEKWECFARLGGVRNRVMRLSEGDASDSSPKRDAGSKLRVLLDGGVDVTEGKKLR